MLLPVPSSCSGAWFVAPGFAFRVVSFQLGALKWLLAFICAFIHIFVYTLCLYKTAHQCSVKITQCGCVQGIL